MLPYGWKSGTLIKVLSDNEHAWKSTMEGDTWTSHHGYFVVNNKRVKMPQGAKHIEKGTVVLFLKGIKHIRTSQGHEHPGLIEFYYLHEDTIWKTVPFAKMDLFLRYELCKKRTVPCTVPKFGSE